VLYLLLPFILVIIFQPYLDRIEDGREKVSKIAIERGTARAALDGYYTSGNIRDIKKMLYAVGYEDQDIQLELTTSPKPRGEYVKGVVKVPNEYQNILFTSLLEGEETEKMYHVNMASRMSENVN